jgi:hypothetical protein
MNIKIYNRAVEMAKALMPNNIDGKSYHCSFAVRKSRIVCVGQNSYTKLHPYHKWGKYKNHKNLPGEYRPNLHSECSLAIRLGEEDLSDYTILNIRINRRGQPVMSDFCPNCFRLLRDLNARKLFYSDQEGNLQERAMN